MSPPLSESSQVIKRVRICQSFTTVVPNLDPYTKTIFLPDLLSTSFHSTSCLPLHRPSRPVYVHFTDVPFRLPESPWLLPRYSPSMCIHLRKVRSWQRLPDLSGSFRHSCGSGPLRLLWLRKPQKNRLRIRPTTSLTPPRVEYLLLCVEIYRFWSHRPQRREKSWCLSIVWTEKEDPGPLHPTLGTDQSKGRISVGVRSRSSFELERLDTPGSVLLSLGLPSTPSPR